MNSPSLRPSPFLADAISHAGYCASAIEASTSYLNFLRKNGGSGLNPEIILRWVLSSGEVPLTELLRTAREQGIPPLNILAIITEASQKADCILRDSQLSQTLLQQIGMIPTTDYDRIHREGRYNFSKQTSPGPLAKAVIDSGLVADASIAVDLGTGNARDAHAIASANSHIRCVGVDSSFSILRSAVQRIASDDSVAHRISLVHGELHHLLHQRPDLRQSADLVNASSVLHLAPRSEFVKTLRYIREHLLRRGGAIALLHKTPRCIRNNDGLLLEEWSDAHAGARVCTDGISRWFDEHDNLIHSVESAGYSILPDSRVAPYAYASDTPDEFSLIMAKSW